MSEVSTVLVTGGSGFIGSYVVEQLLNSGLDVLSFDHSVPSHETNRHPRLKHFLGDIRDEVAVTEAMAHVDGFIHLAGVLGTQETIKNPRPAVMTNITGGLNILEAATQYDVPGVNIAVGNYWENNPYSISKNSVERFAKMFAKERGTRVSNVRALNAYGPGQSIAFPYGKSQVRKIMPSFVMRALNNHPIEIYGDGSQIMDMIYVADVALFLIQALHVTAKRGPIPGTVEAGTGRPTSVLQIAEMVVAEVGQGSITHLPLRGGETPGAVVKADPLSHGLIFPVVPDLVPLETGIRETVNYYRNDVGE